jgi:inactivated superfamily I helicase
MGVQRSLDPIIREVLIMKRFVYLTLILALVLCAGTAFAQAQAEETKSEVPELTAFHDIIYPIWHTAYPAKDTAALRGFVPQINELAAKIYAAKLPGILREKEAKWKEGVATLKKSVEDYNAAAKGTDDPALLNAAEALHSNYEALVRALRPILAEMDAFHQVLYVVYHKHVPAKAFDGIRGVTADLVAKAEAVTKATLPARLSAKAEAFKKAAAELLEAAKALDAAGQAHDHDGMLAGVDKLHGKYEALQGLFD